MLVFLYLTVLITALYWAAKTLLPELLSAPLPTKDRVRSRPVDSYSSNEPDSRINKLEALLAEKTKNIQLLQTELKIFLVQVREYDKVKTLLEEEIHHLREQNRIFRSELGLPQVQSKEQLKESSIK